MCNAISFTDHWLAMIYVVLYSHFTSIQAHVPTPTLYTVFYLRVYLSCYESSVQCIAWSDSYSLALSISKLTITCHKLQCLTWFCFSWKILLPPSFLFWKNNQQLCSTTLKLYWPNACLEILWQIKTNFSHF